MFSKEEASRLRKTFWISYAKSFPRKWVLYNTKIKNFGFKFHADRKQAMVSLDIESSDEVQRELLFEQIVALKKIIENEYFSEAIFDKNYQLENGKIISRIYIIYPKKFSIYNKDTWSGCYFFFNENMHKFELLWFEYQDYIQQAVV